MLSDLIREIHILEDTALSCNKMTEFEISYIHANCQRAILNASAMYKRGFTLESDFEPNIELFKTNRDYRYLYNHFFEHIKNVYKTSKMNVRDDG